MNALHLRILKLIAAHRRPLTVNQLAALLPNNQIQLKTPSIYSIIKAFATQGYITYALGPKRIPPEKAITITSAGSAVIGGFSSDVSANLDYDEIRNALEHDFHFVLLEHYYGGREQLSPKEQRALDAAIAELSARVGRYLQ